MSAATRSPVRLPIAVFIVATFVGAGVLSIVQAWLELDARAVPLVPYAPAIGALVTWAATWRVLGALLPTPVARRQFVAHTVLGVAAAGVFAALFALGVALLAGGGDANFAAVPFALVLLAHAAAGFVSEAGWRGVLQPLLEQTTSRPAAAVFTGVVWGLIAAQMFGELAAAAAFALFAIAASLLLGYLGNGAWWQRAVTAGVVHALVAVALVALAGNRAAEPGVLLIAAVAMALVTTAWLLMFRAAQRKRAARAAV